MKKKSSSGEGSYDLLICKANLIKIHHSFDDFFKNNINKLERNKTNLTY